VAAGHTMAQRVVHARSPSCESTRPCADDAGCAEHRHTLSEHRIDLSDE
jgi:hypothetical protein